MSSSSGECSPVCSSPGPESVACYEECTTDETFELAASSSPLQSPGASGAGVDEEPSSVHRTASGGGSASHGVPKSTSSGRIAKRAARSRPKSLKNRKCSSPFILQWLGENYEMVAGSCLPRSVLYTHYQDFCKKSQMDPSSAASFGKIIRLKFPDLSTRRLGTRGQSKYHYYGLAIRETSIYYRSVYSKKGITRFSGVANKRENGQTYNPSSKTGILLPNFPKVPELDFTTPFPVDKVETFLIMYNAHCQRILDSVVRANFQEVQDFLIHFWQGMPTHMLPILGCQATVDVVVICDFILYRTLCEVLIPASLQSLPDNLIEEIILFSHNIVEWVFNALQDLPAALGIRKVQICEMFGKSLRRQTALVQLAKGVRGVLRNSDDVAALLQDWRMVDVESMILQPEACSVNPDLFRELAHEMEQLFIKQSSLEVYFEWIDSIIEKQISEPGERGLSLVQLSHDFVSSWTTFYTLLQGQFSSSSTKSLEHYNSLHKLMDEYIHYVIELLQSHAIEAQYNDALRISTSSSQLSSGTQAAAAPGSLLPPPPPLHYHPDLYPRGGGEDDLRMVLPPTPDHTPLAGAAVGSEHHHDLFASLGHPHHHGPGKMGGELHLHHTHHHHNINYFPGELHSQFVPGAPEGLCEGIIKHEFPFKCSGVSMSSLPHDTPLTPFPLDSTPLTPQSSHYSSSSPLSHVSMSASPEPPFFTACSDHLDHSPSSLLPLPPHSSMHHHALSRGSPTLTTTPTSAHSPPEMSSIYTQHLGIGVVLAQGHASSGGGTTSSDLDIVRSLELIAGAPNSTMAHSGALTSTTNTMVTEPYHAFSSMSPPLISHAPSSSSSCSASPVHISSFDQYEFELLQLMSNPDDLLADPKILLHSNSAPTPIH